MSPLICQLVTGALCFRSARTLSHNQQPAVPVQHTACLAVSVLLVCAASCRGQHPQCPNLVYIVCAGNLLVTCMPLCLVLGAVGSWWQSSCLVCAIVLPYPVLQAGRRVLFGCLARGGNELFDSERSLKGRAGVQGILPACRSSGPLLRVRSLPTSISLWRRRICSSVWPGFTSQRAGCLVSLHLVVGSLL